MRCEYFNESIEVCSKGLPVSELYKDLVCERRPDKCPVVIGVRGLAAARLG